MQIPAFGLSTSFRYEKNLKPTSTENLNYDTLTDNQKLIYNFYDCIDGESWESWALSYVPKVRNSYLDFVSNNDNNEGNIGILTVNSAEVISIQKIDNSYAPKYKELEEFFDSDDTYECYMVGVDMSVNESTQYYFDGINYKLIIDWRKRIWMAIIQKGEKIRIML